MRTCLVGQGVTVAGLPRVALARGRDDRIRHGNASEQLGKRRGQPRSAQGAWVPDGAAAPGRFPRRVAPTGPATGGGTAARTPSSARWSRPDALGAERPCSLRRCDLGRVPGVGAVSGVHGRDSLGRRIGEARSWPRRCSGSVVSQRLRGQGNKQKIFGGADPEGEDDLRPLPAEGGTARSARGSRGA
jgi:hypothetical protein